ncbi:hypothetical protein [Nocardia sp. NPDC005998]
MDITTEDRKPTVFDRELAELDLIAGFLRRTAAAGHDAAAELAND